VHKHFTDQVYVKITFALLIFLLQLSSPISRTRILDVIMYPSFSQSHMSIYNHPKNKVSLVLFGFLILK